MNLSSPAAVSALLRRHHFLPAHKFGQNFLVDGNTLAKIVAAGELEPGDSVLEVGTGLGVLTRALAEQVGPTGVVATIERDPRLPALHRDTLPADEYSQVRHIAGDALDVDLDEIAQIIGPDPQHGVAVVANIPYNITSPLIARLLEHSPHYRVIVLLVQREVADRLAAKPGNGDYGAFTVFTQFYAEVEVAGIVPPTVFFPPPKITSAIIRLRPRSEPAVAVADRALYFKIVRAAFQQRRKTIANALSGEATGWAKAQASEVLAGAGIDPNRRGETLSLAEFALVEASAGNLGLGGGVGSI